MNTSLARLTIPPDQLANPGTHADQAAGTKDESYPPDLIARLNSVVKPPEMLTADQVYIRAMYVVSDEVNSFGGCFPVDEHPRLAQLLPDSPVMVGHRKDKLPIGRTFHAACETHNSRPWVKAWFYWLRTAESADRLREQIDGGIYRECSIAFTFGLPECSICGRDIRTCEHQPLETYRLHGREETCHFNYRKVDRVLETSLVYRGAVPNTSITNKLHGGISGGHTLDSASSLDPHTRYIIIPRYDGLPLELEATPDRVILTRRDGTTVDLPPDTELAHTSLPRNQPVHALLVGYRGHSRSTLGQLERYLADHSGPVTHLRLFILPFQTDHTVENDVTPDSAGIQLRPMPFRVTERNNIRTAAAQITTALGVEIYPQTSDLSSHTPACFHPNSFADIPDPTPGIYTDSGHRAYLLVNATGSPQCYQLAGGDVSALLSGRFCVVESTERLPDDVTLDPEASQSASAVTVRAAILHGAAITVARRPAAREAHA